MKRTLKKGFRKIAIIKNLKPGQIEQQENEGLVHNANYIVGGVGGGFARVANSINKQIVSLTFDKDYIQTTEIQGAMNRPTAPIEGFKMGLASLGDSIVSGAEGTFV